MKQYLLSWNSWKLRAGLIWLKKQTGARLMEDTMRLNSRFYKFLFRILLLNFTRVHFLQRLIERLIDFFICSFSRWIESRSSSYWSMALTSWPFSFVKISFVRSNSIFAADNFAILASIWKNIRTLKKLSQLLLKIINFEKRTCDSRSANCSSEASKLLRVIWHFFLFAFLGKIKNFSRFFNFWQMRSKRSAHLAHLRSCTR